jgi:CheY-like chemotaxis protein
MARVLIIEDEPLLRKRLVSVLTANGHTVVEAENGQQGIERLKENGLPHLILLDMVMPEANGWGFLDFQRANAVYAGIPVVVISAYEGIALSAKPQAYLPKPVEVDVLLKTIGKFVS